MSKTAQRIHRRVTERPETGATEMNNALHEYQYARYFILSNIRQLRMMVRDGRYVSEGLHLIKKTQAEAARRRAKAYAA